MPITECVVPQQDLKPHPSILPHSLILQQHDVFASICVVLGSADFVADVGLLHHVVVVATLCVSSSRENCPSCGCNK